MLFQDLVNSGSLKDKCLMAQNQANLISGLFLTMYPDFIYLSLTLLPTPAWYPNLRTSPVSSVQEPKYNSAQKHPFYLLSTNGCQLPDVCP
jgi:hypothetical protein